MKIQSLEELRAADECTLAFGPYGLGGRMRAEDAAEYQQLAVADCDLAPEVANGTRQTFERLYRIFAYGVLCYDVYTLVEEHAQLVIEQALRDRFVQWCGGSVTFIDSAGTGRTFPVTSYDDVHDAVQLLRRQARKTRPRQAWRLRAGAELIEFNGTLGGLRSWSRCAGLIRGRRNRSIEQTLSHLRNYVAHSIGHQVSTPVDAARTLHDLAEFINQLWGRPTPGGRLYPAPLQRQVVVIAWDAQGRLSLGPPKAFQDRPDIEGYEYLLVRAAFQLGTRYEDDHLAEFDARFETTRYPADYLWGPGSRTEAMAWLEHEQPQGDTVDHLDRIFLVRESETQFLPPMRPEVAAGLARTEQTGTWHAVRADFPGDACVHVRGQRDSTAGHGKRGDCRACSVQVLASGEYQHVLDAVQATLGFLVPSSPPPVRTPYSLHWPSRP